MAKYKKTGTLDSYSTIRAIARATKEQPPATAVPPDKPAAPPAAHIATGPTDLRKLGAHVARTVLPKKHIIQCHECGYSFQLHGRAKQINCSKCRVMLDLGDHVIDGVSTATVKTAGAIHIAPGGVVQAGELVAQDILLEGTLEGGTLRALRRLEISAAAVFAEKAIRAADLKVGLNAALVFRQPVTFRDVELVGALRANLTATGRVTIHPAALFEGELTTAHLVVEEGGGLQAQLRIGPLPAA